MKQPIEDSVGGGLTLREALSGSALALGGLLLGALSARAETADGEVRPAEAIHQEPVFRADPKRIYEALLDEKRFDAVVRLSPDMRELMGSGSAPTRIARLEGGAFCLFGGHIVGTTIELVPDKRIVQAWRAAHWPPGAYSVVRFDLVPAGKETKIIFDHRGFPDGTAQHLAAGWKQHYWDPLAAYLG